MANSLYKTWFFDCDGVLLDSNSIKTEAFYDIALAYGVKAAELLVKYHLDKGGISRFEKFEYFFKNILGKSDFGHELDKALEEYGIKVKAKLIQCRETQGMREFLQGLLPENRKIVVSGGKQDELREVFKERKLEMYFNGIYGSPQDKLTILSRETSSSKFESPAVFVGDTQYDYECANNLGLDFIFMAQYTDFTNWPEFFKEHSGKVRIIGNLGEL